MSATIEPTEEAPEQERPSFDEAFAALPRGDAPAEDVSDAGQTDGRPDQARASAPGATQEAGEPDDDDEQLPLDQRFARSQRRETREKAAREAAEARYAETEAARRHAESQVNGYKGRTKQLESERDRFKDLAENENARLNTMWEDAIKMADDPGQRADLQDRYERDRDRRELAAEKAQIAFEKQQAQEQVTRTKEAQKTDAAEGMRRYAIPDLLQEIEDYAAQLGLPREEIADIRDTLTAPTMALLVRRMDPLELHQYRTNLGQAAAQELPQRLQAYRERQAGANRQEARQVYRAEQPIGQGGGGDEMEDLKGLDFDQAFDANARNQRRLRGERVTA